MRTPSNISVTLQTMMMRSACARSLYRRKGRNIKVFARGAKTAPRLLKTHKDDVIGILAAFELQSVEEYKKKHKLMDVIKGMVDLINEPEVRQLFFSAPTSAAEEPSGDAQENTEEEA